MPRVLAFLLLCSSCVSAQVANKTINPTFTTIAVPGAGYTNAWQINSQGEIAGTYGAYENGMDGHGFVYANGNYTTFDYPGAYRTLASGINDSGLIVGTVEFEGGLVSNGFFYDGQNYTLFQAPGKPNTYADTLNNAGDVVGSAGYGGGQVNAFELEGKKYIPIRVPGQYLIKEATAINNLGEIVGYAADGDANEPEYGFIEENGQRTIINFPGSLSTQVFGVNDSGIIVGTYFIQNVGDIAFAYKNGVFLSFTYPGAEDTEAVSINNAGQIVGGCTLSDFNNCSFVTSPITDEDFK